MRKVTTFVAFSRKIEVRDLLVTTYPKCFSLWENRRRPLKLKIHLEIMAELGDAITPDELSAVLHWYVSNAVCLRRCHEGSGRIDLQGVIVDWVSAEHAAQCAARLHSYTKRKSASVAKTSGNSAAAPPAPVRISILALKKSAMERRQQLQTAESE
jgi:sRNA-binding protein